MPRYIDVDKAYDLARTDDHYSDFGRSMADLTSLRELLDDTPTADVVEVVHARWIKLGEADYQCSSCGFRFTSGEDISEFKHCRCGAKMDGEEK